MARKKSSALLTSLMLVCGTAFCGEYDPLIGTMEVNFLPMSTAGVINGCSLVFRVVAYDHVYRQGVPIIAVGNYTMMVANPKSFGFSIKLGVANALDKKPKPEVPHYAYIKTSHGTSAATKFVQNDSDVEGYRMYVYETNDKTMGVLGDIIDGENPTIGFNRKKGGMDVFLPVDLTVSETVQLKDGSLKRIHSDNAIVGFRQCVVEVSKKLELPK